LPPERSDRHFGGELSANKKIRSTEPSRWGQKKARKKAAQRPPGKKGPVCQKPLDRQDHAAAMQPPSKKKALKAPRNTTGGPPRKHRSRRRLSESFGIPGRPRSARGATRVATSRALSGLRRGTLRSSLVKKTVTIRNERRDRPRRNRTILSKKGHPISWPSRSRPAKGVPGGKRIVTVNSPTDTRTQFMPIVLQKNSTGTMPRRKGRHGPVAPKVRRWRRMNCEKEN